MTATKGCARGHIEQRASGRYRAIVYAGVDPLTGKERYLREPAPTKKAAQAALSRLQTQVDEKRHPRTGTTFGELLDQWMEVSNHEPSTSQRNADLIRLYLRPHSGPCQQARSTLSCSRCSMRGCGACGRWGVDRLRSPAVRTRHLLCAVVLASAAVLPACSSTPAIGSALDDGQPALLAARTAYGDAGGDAATAARMLRQGEQEVRESCPEHNGAAAEMGQLAAVVGLAP